MRKHIFLFILIVGISLFAFAEKEDLLRIEASLGPKRLSRGQKGKVVLKLTLEEGIFVSPEPSFIIEFSPCEELIIPKSLSNESDLETDILKENGEDHLDLREAIEIPFTVRLMAKRGRHLLEGKIKYFACSKEEGWCLKNTSKFSAVFYIR
ncbi:MAG TPA: hypothetical protein ENI18_04090 [Candidatus Aminicenantes bacterium]|nr:hypothetical protein [Candidatus Aminicenantes bacterium]